jgi:oligopeptide/dipeptide ABC transporter ATP-binding protein
MTMTDADPRALEVTDLTTQIKLSRSTVQAVGNVDIAIDAGETLGLVGESGCGKSMLGLSILGLLPKGGTITQGSVQLGGRELVGLPDSELRRLRGNEVAMIFQDSQSSLNPTKTIGEQVAEPVRLHRGASRTEANNRALEVLELVGLPQPRERMRDYPHKLSGGMRQRVMIAIALACEPKVLLADEPTTALDATVQIQVLILLRKLQRELGMGTIFVTHDLGVASEIADRIAVMYAGRIVEEGPVDEVLRSPLHPYTQGLLASTVHGQSRDQDIEAIPGSPPDMRRLPAGCAFAPRCIHVQQECHNAVPLPRYPSHGRMARCVRVADGNASRPWPDLQTAISRANVAGE